MAGRSFSRSRRHRAAALHVRARSAWTGSRHYQPRCRSIDGKAGRTRFGTPLSALIECWKRHKRPGTKQADDKTRYFRHSTGRHGDLPAEQVTSQFRDTLLQAANNTMAVLRNVSLDAPVAWSLKPENMARERLSRSTIGAKAIGALSVVMQPPRRSASSRVHAAFSRTESLPRPRTKNWSRYWAQLTNGHVTDRRDKAFHSFRHGFVRMLRNGKTSETTIKALVGHVDGGDATAGYGGDEGFIHDLAVLADAVATISMPELDLSYLVRRWEALGW